MTLCTAPTMTPRPQVRERRPGRPPSGKRLAMATRALPGKLRAVARRSLDPCDNSNDSGLGFDHHMDPQHTMNMGDRLLWTGERSEAKRPRMDIKLENDDFGGGYSFPETIRSCKESTSLIRTAPACSVPALSMNSNQSNSQGRAVPRCIPLINRHSPAAPVTLTTQLSNASRYMDISLSIIKQPEQQHRARYQTEGSRGAVKDREGNGFPIVQLIGYHKPATLQVFIGTDIGKVAPHMFYQACRVSGKNSTPCTEKKIDGTIVIELQLEPTKDMLATCDCVGILKERNVDVEHRFPDQLGSRSKKKSTRCRMIFRTTITHDDGAQETLQVCSQPIVCTQPPGIPEICKKSLSSCPASGGLELFVLGKNFLKDTRIYFQQVDEDRHVRWEQSVAPDKEFLQQTHFVCVIPPFVRPDITEPVTVRLYVVSSGKTSEPHQFVYTPVNGAMPSVRVEPPPPTPFLSKMLWSNVSKQEQDLGMMPPPGTNMVPLSSRRSSATVSSVTEIHSPPVRMLKQELMDDSSQSSVMDPSELHQERYRHLSESSLDVHQGDSNMSMINDNSIDMLRHNPVTMEMMNPNMNDNSNMSSMNENSMEMMVRCSSVSRPVSSIYEGSMDVNLSNSNLTVINEDSSCSTVMHCSNPERHIPQPALMMSSAHMNISPVAMEEMKGIDLRMKMSMGTVADLVHTKAPSMATLHRFCVTEATAAPLPTQSAQSIENYLTTLESPNKPITALSSSISSMVEKDKLPMSAAEQNALFAQKLLSSHQVMPSQTMSAHLLTPTNETLPHLGASQPSVSESESVYITSQQQHLSKSAQNDSVNIVAKSEAAAIAEQNISEQTTLTSTTISAMSSASEGSIPLSINTEKFDAIVNSAVDSHICSPSSSSSSSSKDGHISKPNSQQDIMLTSQDVMLNSQSPLLAPPITTSSISSSPNMTPTEVIPHPHTSPSIPGDVILNPQISPSMMCHNSNELSEDSLLPASSVNSMESNLIPPQMSVSPNISQPSIASLLSNGSVEMSGSLHSAIPNLVGNTEAEKEILFKATVDLLQTQKKICELDKGLANNKEKMHIMGDFLNTTGQLSNTGNNFVQSQYNVASRGNVSPNMISSKSVADNKTDYSVIPVPVKEMAGVSSQHDKKNEDTLIPPVFATMSENELINIINPSCFDQGNNFH